MMPLIDIQSICGVTPTIRAVIICLAAMVSKNNKGIACSGCDNPGMHLPILKNEYSSYVLEWSGVNKNENQKRLLTSG